MTRIPESPATSTELDRGLAELRRDLLSFDSPQISTVRNYNFAIFCYGPSLEFEVRRKMQALTQDLKIEGWDVLSVPMQKVLHERLRTLGDETLTAWTDRERGLHQRDPQRALTFLKEKLAQQIEGPDGLAKDVARRINEFISESPDRAARTVVFLGRLGALYPFFRTSALLKHLASQVPNVPIIVLYPGERRDQSALSFMSQLEPDRDYRPRIYP